MVDKAGGVRGHLNRNDVITGVTLNAYSTQTVKDTKTPHIQLTRSIHTINNKLELN